MAAELGTNCNLGKTMASVCPAWRCPHHDVFPGSRPLSVVLDDIRLWALDDLMLGPVVVISAWQSTISTYRSNSFERDTWQCESGCGKASDQALDGSIAYVYGADGHLSDPTAMSSWGCLFKQKGRPWAPFLGTLTYFSSLRVELLLSIHSCLIDSSFGEIEEHPSALL